MREFFREKIDRWRNGIFNSLNFTIGSSFLSKLNKEIDGHERKTKTDKDNNGDK